MDANRADPSIFKGSEGGKKIYFPIQMQLSLKEKEG